MTTADHETNEHKDGDNMNEKLGSSVFLCETGKAFAIVKSTA